MKRFRWVWVILAFVFVAAACGRGDDSESTPAATTAAPSAATTTADACKKEALKATDVGVTATDITITVMADTGSPLAPGLFQGSIDAVKAWADAVNKVGGVGCRQVKVNAVDSKLNPAETVNGTIEACKNSFAMVGTTSLALFDASNMLKCADLAGKATGLPDIAQLATEIPHTCNPTTFPVNAAKSDCPYSGGERSVESNLGAAKYYQTILPNAHGIFRVGADLPSAIQSSTYQIRSAEKIGIINDGEFAVSGSLAQAGYGKLVQQIKQKSSNFVYDISNDASMVKIRKEAKAQGVDTVKIWGCSLACYTPNLISTGGADVEGTYMWMSFLPFEESDTNAELKAYLDAVGGLSKATSWGAGAWADALLFKTAVDQIVKTDGPNAITRDKLLAVLPTISGFTANGWWGTKPTGRLGISNCVVVIQVKNGKFERVFPTERGKLSCSDSNMVTSKFDPTKEFHGL
jgi:ABC-type branched-subunit amino acid transport system substrate-binding protein